MNVGTTVSFTFPLGRYHATPWDMAANSGAVEWPPSPWRILRALLSVAHERCPDLAAESVDEVLARLGNPDAYLTPETAAGSTRHYMASSGHRTDNTGNTDQVLDGFLTLDSTMPLIVHWDAELTDAQRLTLETLVSRMPYLGRSESICIASVTTESAIPDESWWRLGAAGDLEVSEILGLDGPPARAILEQTTSAVRKDRRAYPAGSRLLRYARRAPKRVAPQQRISSHVNAIRFELKGTVPIRMRNFILATDAMHGLVRHSLEGLPTDLVAEIIGKDGDGPRRKDHDHLHIAALPTETPKSPQVSGRATVGSILLWTQDDIDETVVSALTSRPRSLRTRQEHLKGQFPEQRLLLAGVGRIDELPPPNWIIPATDWVSATPYLPVRHRHSNRTMAQHLLEDLTAECAYRGLPAPVEVAAIDTRSSTSQLPEFRRRRISASISKNRQSVYAHVKFNVPVSGPLFLGALSHFGFGHFVAPG